MYFWIFFFIYTEKLYFLIHYYKVCDASPSSDQGRGGWLRKQSKPNHSE